MTDTTRPLPPATILPGLYPTLTVATLIQILATASVLALTALAPEVAGELGIGEHWIGYQISLIYFAGVFSSAVAGSFVLRHGPERVERFALLCFGLGFLALASGRLAPILAASVAIGVGYGLNNPAASQMLSRVTPPIRRNIVFSVKQSGVPLGGVLAALALPAAAHGIGWRAALASAAVAPLAHAHVMAATGERPERGGAPGPKALRARFLAEQRLLFASRPLAVLSLLGFLYSALQLSVSAFVVVALVEGGRWTLLQAGTVAAATQFAGALGRVFWGVVADRVGGFRILALIGWCSGLLCLSLPLLPAMPAWLQAAVFVALGALSIGWNGVLLAETARYAPPGEVGAITGALLVYTFIGVIIGPSSFALLYGAIGRYGAVFALFAALGFVGGALAWRLRGVR